jgi:hypothetical protein
MADQHFPRRGESPATINVPLGARAAWMATRLEGWRAYRDWCAAPPAEKLSAFIRYRAAADREDAAAAMLQRVAANGPVIGLPASFHGAVRAFARVVGR